MSASSWTKALSLQRMIHNPSAWSAVLSLGAHALLFLALPFIPLAGLKTEEPDIRRTVGVVELNPTEQNRLPKFSTPQIQLPPVASKSDSAPLSQLPSQTVPPSLSSSLPPTSFIPYVPPLPPVTLPPPPSSSSIYTIPTQPTESQSKPRPTPRTTATPSPQPSPTSTPQAAATATPSPEPSSTASPEPSRTRTLDDIRQARVAEIEAMRQAMAPDATGTRPDEPLQRFVAWYEQVNRLAGSDYKAEKPKEIDIAADYPPAACAGRLSGGAIVGVLVNADGKVADEPGPIILQGSGYRILNQQAIDAAKAHQFDPPGSKKVYQIRVKFEYSRENCPPRTAPTPSGSPSPAASAGSQG